MTWPWEWWAWLLIGLLLAGIVTAWVFVFRGARKRLGK